MTDEPTAGQSPEDNASTEAPQATQDDSTQTVVDDGLPERFKGKSPAEIAQSYDELEKKMGDLGREKGELQNELSFIKTQAQVPQGQQQPAQTGQQQTEDYDDRFLQSPYQATMQILGQYDQMRSQRDAERDFPRTMREVENLRPDLFGDKELAKQVGDAVRKGVKDGSFRPDVQSDATSIIAIGAYLKDQKTWQNPQPIPVTPVVGESPVQVKKDTPIEEPIVWTRDEEDFIDHAINAGIYKDRKEAAVEYRKERKE